MGKRFVHCGAKLMSTNFWGPSNPELLRLTHYTMVKNEIWKYLTKIYRM